MSDYTAKFQGQVSKGMKAGMHACNSIKKCALVVEVLKHTVLSAVMEIVITLMILIYAEYTVSKKLNFSVAQKSSPVFLSFTCH